MEKVNIEEGINRNNSEIKCMCCNVRSIVNKGKIEDLRLLMSAKGLAIVGVTESWAHEEIGDAEINIKGCSVFRRDRDVDKGGKKRGEGTIICQK